MRLGQVISFHIAGTITSVFLGHLPFCELLFVDDILIGCREIVSCSFGDFLVPMNSIDTMLSNAQITITTVIELNEQNYLCFFPTYGCWDLQIFQRGMAKI